MTEPAQLMDAESTHTAHEGRERLRRVWVSAAALLPATIFSWRGLGHLYSRHPHEDAFILFRYVEHLAAGHGLVFNAGGPATEGATDFLFVVVLAGLVRLGVDVAIAALALNTLGSGLIGWLFGRLQHREGAGALSALVAVLLAGAVPFLAGAHASYDGFGTLAYCALAVWAYYAYLQGSERALVTLPYLGLALGLFRPDGVVLGVGFYATALLTHVREPSLRRRLILHGAVAFVTGVIYFVWRYRYFGEMLPLPLYAKSHGGRLAGLSTNRDWLSNANGPGPLLVVAGVFSVALVALRSRSYLRPLLGTLPGWLSIAAFTFAFQSQNVDWRFQAPAYTIFLACTIALGAELRANMQTTWAQVTVCAACLFALVPALHEGKKIWPRDYMDSFAVRLGPVLDRNIVALTEAGRMAYWSEADVYDMIGLNLTHTAKHPPTVEYLASLEPDIVMFHAAGTLDFARLGLAAERSAELPVARIDPHALPQAVHEGYRRYLGAISSNYAQGDLATKIAPVVMSNFLATRSNYSVYAVRYNNSYTHVFGIRRDSRTSAAVERVLLESHRLPYLSYAAAKGFPNAERRARLTASGQQGSLSP